MKRFQVLPPVDSQKWIRPIGTPIIDRPERTLPNGLERPPRNMKPSRPPYLSLVKQ